MHIFKHAIACTFAATLVAGGMNPAVSAPMPTHVGTMKAMVSQDTTQVYWRGGGWRGGGWGWGGWGAGALAGALIGGAIASAAIGGPYYGGAYYGYPSAYYDPYGYRAPRVAYYGYGPSYGYGAGYGYGPGYGYARPYRVYPRYYGRAYGGYW